MKVFSVSTIATLVFFLNSLQMFSQAIEPTSVSQRPKQPNIEKRRLSPEDVQKVAPALEKNTQELLYGKVWKRPSLSPRDRSVVTISGLIALNQAGALTYYFDQAIENGVKPSEISEIITHLAFYSGWGNAFAAIGPARNVFALRGVGTNEIPAAVVPLLPLDESSEAKRADQVKEQFGMTAPGLVEFTTDALFRDLWLRPGLNPRDRSLVTVSALIASGQVGQIPYHLNRAMDNGLTQEQAGEVISHLAFYAGWPNAFSALPVAKEIFAKRAQGTNASGAQTAGGVPREENLQGRNTGMLIRISEIQIHAEHLEEYTAILKEEAEASVKLEPGVLCIFPMFRKENPAEFRILEIYASRAAYEGHIKSPHFQKYKTTTLKMVKALKLVDMETIDAATMTEIFRKMGSGKP